MGRRASRENATRKQLLVMGTRSESIGGGCGVASARATGVEKVVGKAETFPSTSGLVK